jgi:hypothetical protein
LLQPQKRQRKDRTTFKPNVSRDIKQSAWSQYVRQSGSVLILHVRALKHRLFIFTSSSDIQPHKPNPEIQL